MKTKKEILAIADQKLIDAELLFQNSRYDNAIYLAGYTVELYLKAKIAERLGCDDLFLFNRQFHEKIILFTRPVLFLSHCGYFQFA